MTRRRFDSGEHVGSLVVDAMEGGASSVEFDMAVSEKKKKLQNISLAVADMV